MLCLQKCPPLTVEAARPLGQGVLGDLLERSPLGYGELFYNWLSQGAYMFVANRFFLQATATSNYVCWYLSPNTPEGHYNKRTLSKQQFRSGEHNPIAVKTIIDVNTINPLLTFTKRSTRCLFLRLKLNLFCTRGKLKYMPRVMFELTTLSSEEANALPTALSGLCDTPPIFHINTVIT